MPGYVYRGTQRDAGIGKAEEAGGPPASGSTGVSMTRARRGGESIGPVVNQSGTQTVRREPENDCGSYPKYHRHIRAGVPVDEIDQMCIDARNEYRRDRRAEDNARRRRNRAKSKVRHTG